MSPSPDNIDYELASSSPYSQQRLSVPVANAPTTHSKIERHVSEPARLSSQSPPPISSAAAPVPASTSSTMHLLTVPHGPVLTKQHSAPSESICDTQFSYHHRSDPHSHFSLHRQLSLPSHSPPGDIVHRGDPFAAVVAAAAAAAAASSSSSSSIDKESMSEPSSHTTMRPSSPESKPIAHDLSPTYVVVAEPIDQTTAPPQPSTQSTQPMRVREELQRSVSSPQVCLK